MQSAAKDAAKSICADGNGDGKFTTKEAIASAVEDTPPENEEDIDEIATLLTEKPPISPPPTNELGDESKSSRQGDRSENKSNNHKPSWKRPKLGILLIDHGSKRKASNEHLMSIAQSYQSTWDEMLSATTANGKSKGNGGRVADGTAISKSIHNPATALAPAVSVRGAHMEIAPPSILSSLRQLVTQDEATVIICVHYFLR